MLPPFLIILQKKNIQTIAIKYISVTKLEADFGQKIFWLTNNHAKIKLLPSFSEKQCYQKFSLWTHQEVFSKLEQMGDTFLCCEATL